MKLTNIIRELSDRSRVFKAVTELTGGTFGVDSVVITNAGAGHSGNFAVTFAGGSGAGAAATAIVEDGEVVDVIMTSPGAGYTEPPAADFSAGDGAGTAGTVLVTPHTLDAVPTEALTPPAIGLLLIGGQLHIYALVADDDAESAPDVIRPDDYDAGDAKVWQLQARFKGAAPMIKNDDTGEWHTIGVRTVDESPSLYASDTSEP